MKRNVTLGVGCVWLLVAVATACGASSPESEPGQGTPPVATVAQPAAAPVSGASQTSPTLPAAREEATPLPTMPPISQLPPPNAQATPRGRLDSEYTRHYRAGDTAKQAGDYETAVKEYGEAIKIIPDITRAYTIRGESYLYLGQYEKAIKDFEAAMAIDDTVVSAYAGRSIAYELMGETEKAKEDFELSLVLGMDRDVLDRFLKFKVADIRNVLASAGANGPDTLPESGAATTTD